MMNKGQTIKLLHDAVKAARAVEMTKERAGDREARICHQAKASAYAEVMEAMRHSDPAFFKKSIGMMREMADKDYLGLVDETRF